MFVKKTATSVFLCTAMLVPVSSFAMFPRQVIKPSYPAKTAFLKKKRMTQKALVPKKLSRLTADLLLLRHAYQIQQNILQKNLVTLHTLRWDMHEKMAHIVYWGHKCGDVLKQGTGEYQKETLAWLHAERYTRHEEIMHIIALDQKIEGDIRKIQKDKETLYSINMLLRSQSPCLKNIELGGRGCESFDALLLSKQQHAQIISWIYEVSVG